jgi:hypothetical protein
MLPCSMSQIPSLFTRYCDLITCNLIAARIRRAILRLLALFPTTSMLFLRLARFNRFDRQFRSPRDLADRVARRSGAGLQLAIDDFVDEGHIVHDREMGALANVDLQTRIGETAPA